MDLHSYGLFLATAAVLVLMPGPDTVLILSRTLASGTAAGLATLIGTQVGNVIHALLAGIGASTIVLLVPFAFTALKLVGVVYLLWLGWQAWRSPAALRLDPDLARRGDGAARFFVQGLANNLSNPKMIAFFLALFPQFVHPGQGALALQSLLLGGTLALMAVVWIGLVAVLAGRFRTAIATSPTVVALANRLAAITFLGLACRLALEEAR